MKSSIIVFFTILIILCSKESTYGIQKRNSSSESVVNRSHELSLEYFIKERKVATNLFEFGSYLKCKSLLLRELPKLKQLGNTYELAEWQYLIGRSFAKLSSKDSSEYYLGKSLDLAIKNNSTSLLVAKIFIQYADLYSIMAQIDSSKYYVKKSINFLSEHHPFEEIELSNAKEILARNLWYQKDYELSLTYLKEREIFLKQKFGENNKYLAYLYTHFFECYRGKGDRVNQKKYMEKALLNGLEFYHSNHPILVRSQLDAGIYYFENGQLNKALEFYEAALKSSIMLNGEKQVIVAGCYYNIAATYNRQKEYNSALVYRKKALKVYREILPEKNPKVALMYGGLSGDYARLEQYDSAVYCSYKVIEHNVLTTDPITDINSISIIKIENILDMNLYINSIVNLAINYRRSFINDHNLNKMIDAFNLYRYCESLVNMIYESHLNDKDKLSFNTQILYIYTEAVNTCTELYKKTNEAIYLDKAFDYSEKTKAGLIMKSRLKSKTYGSSKEILPNSKVDSLKRKLQKLYFVLRNEKVKNSANDSLLGIYNKNISSTILELELVNSNPEFDDGNLNSMQLDIAGVQNYLKSNEVLIEYFTGDRWYSQEDYIYVFVITKDKSDILILEKDNLANSIDSLRKIILTEIPTFDPQDYYNAYVKHASNLYSMLLKQPLKLLEGESGLNHLIIIPDNIISYVPFEILIKEDDSQKNINYSHLEYLINDYSVSYAYSYLLRSFNRSNIKSSGKKEFKYLGYAPTYDDVKKDSTSLLSLGKFRDSLVPLKWNKAEVSRISITTNGFAMTDYEATEQDFKSKVNESDIVHLAMHGFIDDEDPLNSKLVFTQGNDSIEDGFLHTYELFKMKFNPKLAVLSACNTGYGKLQKGEGVMSLAYAFAYAGCPSLVVSQWQVDDKSTSELMQSFYKYLKNGEDKHEALRKAKLDFLSSANSVYANPFYWGSFIFIGDTEPIEFNDYSRYLWFIPGLFVIMLIVVFTIKNKRRIKV